MINPIKFFTITEYTVAYRFSDKNIFEDTETLFTIFPLKENYWIADPFVFIYDGNIFVFVEVFDKNKNYASIGVCEVKDGKMTEPRIIIDDGTHMSYPNVFEMNDKIYLIPENCTNSKIRVFECECFPEKWIELSPISEKPYYDATVWKNRNDEVCMFASLASGELYGSDLYLLKLKQNKNRWCVCKKKLITTDNSISRQGGNVLTVGDDLFRVSQDCSGMEYGKALNIMKIENCQFDNYRERLYKKFTAKSFCYDINLPFKQGVHTYNRAGQFDIIDLKVGVFSLSCFMDKVKFAFSCFTSLLRKKK